jgi:EAL domain-containing protein (putative c-di-GMP-specific phosphodiesterase class I)/DNA-binding NarL/FixJ family response regulator
MSDLAGASAHVLVVEDVDGLRRVLCRILERNGFTTVEAPDGTTALEILRTGGVDLVLLDHGLPDMTGRAVLERLRLQPETATLPVILVTGRGEPEERVAGLGAGADDYLVKPVDGNELVARVRAQLRGRDAWRHQVTSELQARAALAGAIADLDAELDTKAVFAQVCRLMEGMPGVTRCSSVLLGDAGLDPVLRAELVQAAVRIDGAIDASLAARLGSVGSRAVALPVTVAHRTVAVLVADLDPGATRTEVRRAMLDLLPVVNRVVAGSLGDAIDREGAVAIDAVLERTAFRPVYQPIYECDPVSGARTVRGYEALTRFLDGTRPDEMFALARTVGRGADLELATMQAALDAARRLPSTSYLSVNVSAVMLVTAPLGAVLDRAAGRPLVLELTEHERIDDYAAVHEAISGLTSQVRLSVDDAGSGWASLRHVFALAPDFVKLDRGWVHGVDSDPARQALLLGIAEFVKEMGGKVVAEGVETEAELEVLGRLGIRFVQGFLLGHPRSIDDISGEIA